MAGLEELEIIEGTTWNEDVVLGYVRETSKNTGEVSIRVGDINVGRIIETLAEEGKYHIGFEDKVLTVLHHGGSYQNA
ncbi:MAG: hypothetical protein ABIJ14_01370 [Nanoarchaeota archaeon]|nr:hypothetical protein [Nanoarchaeota archaeon]